MNQLNKLIEHIFLEEILYRGSENAVWKSDQDKFVARLSSALASRPTCTATGRMFLDEIREKGRWSEDDENLAMEGLITFPDGDTTIWQPDFKTPLKELVNE